MNNERIKNFIGDENLTIVDAMGKIDNNGRGVLFIVDKDCKLVGVLTDGDIRRWLIKTGDLSAQISVVMNKSPQTLTHRNKDVALEVMRKKRITAIPVVNAIGCITDIYHLSELDSIHNSSATLLGVPVVVMAGGKGTRLYPYTKILPKPLIPIGEIPIIERVMDSLADYGVNVFYMTVNYKKNMIQSYFAEIEKDYSIEYVEEEKPLGTGGSLKLINRNFDKAIIVANCDSLIRTDYNLLYEHHISSGNAITMVTSLKNDTIPYGVVYSREDGAIDHIDEKPVRSYLINTGMYVVNPEMINLIPSDCMFHMTDLVEKSMNLGYKVGMYPVSEDSFLDMGEFAEMKRMEEKLNIQ